MDADAPPLTGRLLVAAPQLRDPNFARTVVLLLDHGDEGAIGVVLNRPSEVGVDAVLPDWAARAAPPPVVFVGGPVQPDALLGLTRLDPAGGARQVLPGLGAADLGGSAGATRAPVRLFAGYAGWGAGQLEGEIAEGGWFVVAGSADDAMTGTPERLWRAVLVRQGGVFRTVPDDPSAN